MAERLVNIDRQTPMLLPPDLREWVAENDLAHLVLEAVELCDMRGAQLNVRGSGSEPISSQHDDGAFDLCLLHGAV